MATMAARSGWLAKIAMRKPAAASSSRPTVRVGGRHGDQRNVRRPVDAPPIGEPAQLAEVALLRVDQDGVGAGVGVGLRAVQGLVDAEAGDQRLGARDDDEVGARAAAEHAASIFRACSSAATRSRRTPA